MKRSQFLLEDCSTINPTPMGPEIFSTREFPTCPTFGRHDVASMRCTAHNSFYTYGSNYI